MILNARHTDETITPGVIEVVYDDKVVYVSSVDQEEYLELQEWISNGNEVILFPLSCGVFGYYFFLFFANV